MKKNYIEPTSKCVEIEEEQLICESPVLYCSPESEAKESLGMQSKDRSGYAHEDLGWDY